MPHISARFLDDNQAQISVKEAIILKTNSEYLKSALSFEQNFDFIVRNFHEYELTLARISIEQMTKNYPTPDILNEYISEINLKLMNLFSTFKSYRDKTPKIIKTLTDDMELFNTLCSQKYDTCFSFRLIDALRNLAQHSEEPMSLLMLGGSWEGKPNSTKANLEYYTNPIIDTEVLKLKQNFKTSILPHEPQKFHLTFCIKQYIECLSSVHKDISKRILADVQKMKDATFVIVNGKITIPKDNFIFLYENDDDEFYKTLCLDFEKFILLNRKHLRFTNLSNHCINTKTPKTEKDKFKSLNKLESKSKSGPLKYFITLKNNKNEIIYNQLDIENLPPSCLQEIKAIIKS